MWNQKDFSFDSDEADANDETIPLSCEQYPNYLNIDAQHFTVFRLASFADDFLLYERNYQRK